MEDIEQVRTLIKRVDKEIADRTDPDRRRNVKTLRSLYLLNIIKGRLKRIESLLKIEKYNLVFIGQIGVGKTTAICHLLGLTRSAKKTISKTLKNKTSKRTIEYTKEILSTGSGKTTICEVVICPAETTYIEVVPASSKEVDFFLRDFCEIIWKKVYPDKSSHLQPLSVEISRAVRNMLGLQEGRKEVEIGSQEKQEIDDAVELAKTYEKDDFEAFKDCIFEKAQLTSRTEKILRYQSSKYSTLDDEKIWIEKNFKDLNLVNLPNFPLPGQIKIHVSPQILDFGQLPFLQSVIDTRGLDAVRDRIDIEAYVREHNDAICVFTDSFPASPNNVSEPLARYLTHESEDLDTKVVLMVLPRKGEPESKMGPFGRIDDREEGILQCKREIELSLNGQNIKFVNENIIFFDPLLYYNANHCIDPEYDQEFIEYDKNEVFSEFDEIVNVRKQKLLTEASEIEKKFWKIIDGNDLSHEDERVLENIKKLLRERREIRVSSMSITSNLLEYLKSQYASVLNAINRRYGEYGERSIYFEARKISEELAKNNFGTPKKEINGIISMAREQASSMSGLQPIMDLIEDEVDKIYEEFSISLADQISTLLKEEKLAPQSRESSFWCAVQDRWGSGEGFVKDVLSHYKSGMGGLNSTFEEEIKRIWEQELMQFLMSFLGDQDEIEDMEKIEML